MYGQPCIAAVLLVFTIITVCSAQWNTGDGNLYKLSVVQDVWVERSTRNYNNWRWLIVGKATLYPKKRALVRFEDIPSACTNVNFANMYLYYNFSGKPSWLEVTEAPFIIRTIKVHRVLKSWNETEADTIYRDRQSGATWDQPYLGLDDTDADNCPTDQVTFYSGRPSGFVEFDVTSAVKEWKAGKSNYGLLLWATNEDQDGRDTRFFSSYYRDSDKHPYLAINCD